MKHILTPEQMRATDSYAINDLGIASAILMENAARSSAIYVRKIINSSDKPHKQILILCGSGNNGGDGFALARHLNDDCDVVVLWLGAEEKMSPETLANFKALVKIGTPLIHITDEKSILQYFFDADCIIDALVGVGGSENLKGLVIPLLQRANSASALKVAIDAPTGLNTHTGLAHCDAFIADYTITMFAIKSGMLLNKGIALCGQILTADLGAPSSIVTKFAEIHSYENGDLCGLLPVREKLTSKFDYGRVIIIAGSKNMPGAAALAANAAITAGAGLVYLFAPSIHKSVLPEVIPIQAPANDTGSLSVKALDTIKPWFEKADVVAFGPGFGPSRETVLFSKMLIEQIPSHIKIIIDADGLKAVDFESKLRSNILLTPHIGEFAGITGLPRSEVTVNAPNLAKEWAERLGSIILLKHLPSIITDGKTSYWNINGNPGMSTAGSGDVLTGIISALAAQKQNLLDSAAKGAFIHAMAGDYYAEKFGQYTLTASELIKSLKEVMP